MVAEVKMGLEPITKDLQSTVLPIILFDPVYFFCQAKTYLLLYGSTNWYLYTMLTYVSYFFHNYSPSLAH